MSACALTEIEERGGVGKCWDERSMRQDITVTLLAVIFPCDH